MAKRNLIIFTDAGGDSDDTAMLLMARQAHLQGDCNVLAVVCGGTHNNRASADYAHWLVNPQWVEIPVLSGVGGLNLPKIYPTPTFQAIQSYTALDMWEQYERSICCSDTLTYLICSPTTEVMYITDALPCSSKVRIKLALMGILDHGLPDYESSYNFRADKDATVALFQEIHNGRMEIDLVVGREECYQYAITKFTMVLLEREYGKPYHLLPASVMVAHFNRLVGRNLNIVKTKLPEVWDRVYSTTEERPDPPIAIPYDAVAFWNTVYPGETNHDFWRRLYLAFNDHPRNMETTLNE